MCLTHDAVIINVGKQDVISVSEYPLSSIVYDIPYTLYTIYEHYSKKVFSYQIKPSKAKHSLLTSHHCVMIM